MSIFVPKFFLFIVLLFFNELPTTAHAVLVSVVGQMQFETQNEWWDPIVTDLNGGNPFTIDVGPDGSFVLPTSVYDATGSVAYTISSGPISVGTVVAHNLPGSFGPGANPITPCPTGANGGACVPGAGFGGTMKLAGNLLMYGYSGVFISALQLSAMGQAQPALYGTNGTAWGNAWTTGRVSASDGFLAPHPVLTVTGHFWNSGTNVGSEILLVTPARHSRYFWEIDMAMVSSLTLTVVPEPSSVLLLGSGIAALCVLRSRKSSTRVPGARTLNREGRRRGSADSRSLLSS